jgi:hypothetical protein
MVSSRAWSEKKRNIEGKRGKSVEMQSFFQCSSVRVSTQFVARDTQPGAEILSRRAAGSRHRASHHLFNQGAACLSV